MIPDKLDTMNSAIKKNSHNETHVIVILLFDQAEILVRYCAYDSPNIRELFFLRSTIKTKRREYVFFPYNCAMQAKKYVVFFHKT